MIRLFLLHQILSGVRGQTAPGLSRSLEGKIDV